jgi:hypothetical protein
MPKETISNDGGQIMLGVIARPYAYVLGTEPKLTEAEEADLLGGDYLPSAILRGDNYALVIYNGRDFLDSDDDHPDSAFVSYAEEVSQGLGQRALSEALKYIYPKHK